MSLHEQLPHLIQAYGYWLIAAIVLRARSVSSLIGSNASSRPLSEPHTRAASRARYVIIRDEAGHSLGSVWLSDAV